MEWVAEYLTFPNIRTPAPRNTRVRRARRQSRTVPLAPWRGRTAARRSTRCGDKFNSTRCLGIRTVDLTSRSGCALLHLTTRRTPRPSRHLSHRVHAREVRQYPPASQEPCAGRFRHVRGGSRSAACQRASSHRYSTCPRMYVNSGADRPIRVATGVPQDREQCRAPNAGIRALSLGAFAPILPRLPTQSLGSAATLIDSRR